MQLQLMMERREEKDKTNKILSYLRWEATLNLRKQSEGKVLVGHFDILLLDIPSLPSSPSLFSTININLYYLYTTIDNYFASTSIISITMPGTLSKAQTQDIWKYVTHREPYPETDAAGILLYNATV